MEEADAVVADVAAGADTAGLAAGLADSAEREAQDVETAGESYESAPDFAAVEQTAEPADAMMVEAARLVAALQMALAAQDCTAALAIAAEVVVAMIAATVKAVPSTAAVVVADLALSATAPVNQEMESSPDVLNNASKA
jgi:hypothetical protein